MENCKQLYDDLIKVIVNNRKSHFFGSIVSVYNPSGRNTEFLVIDGQQRLTTVSLLFLAMYNLISKGIVVSEDESIGKQIYEDYLVDYVNSIAVGEQWDDTFYRNIVEKIEINKDREVDIHLKLIPDKWSGKILCGKAIDRYNLIFANREASQPISVNVAFSSDSGIVNR